MELQADQGRGGGSSGNRWLREEQGWRRNPTPVAAAKEGKNSNSNPEAPYKFVAKNTTEDLHDSRNRIIRIKGKDQIIGGGPTNQGIEIIGSSANPIATNPLMHN